VLGAPALAGSISAAGRRPLGDRDHHNRAARSKVRLSKIDPKSACQEWSVMGRTSIDRAQAPPPTGGSAAGTAAAYAAAIVVFAYALVSLYWAAGGHGLVSTVGGYVEQFARHGGALAVLVALAAVAAKVAGGLLALALVRPGGN
jgi:hypothetical protein